MWVILIMFKIEFLYFYCNRNDIEYNFLPCNLVTESVYRDGRAEDKFNLQFNLTRTGCFILRKLFCSFTLFPFRRLEIFMWFDRLSPWSFKSCWELSSVCVTMTQLDYKLLVVVQKKSSNINPINNSKFD